MKATCERCGRPIVAAGAASGARTEAICSCDRVPAVLAATEAPTRPARDAGPLPGPREGNLEVDPWSLPAPEGGYENLELDDAPAPVAAPPPTAAPAETPVAPDASPDIASSVAARAGAEPAEPPARPRKAILVGAGVAVAVVAAIAIALAVRGGSSGTAGTRGGVRVTVTQEVRWDQPPPLAPIDPSFVERARPAPIRPAAASTRPSAPARPGRIAPPARTTASAAPAGPAEADEAPPPPAPQPSPAAAAPEPQPAQPPPAPVTAADIPLPPPPVIAARPAPPATAAKARAPVLETRTCVADALQVPRGLEGSLPGEVVMHVDVADDGRPANVSFPDRVDPRLRNALVSAVRTCRFTPGADASGRPAAASTTMRLRFE